MNRNKSKKLLPRLVIAECRRCIRRGANSCKCDGLPVECILIILANFHIIFFWLIGTPSGCDNGKAGTSIAFFLANFIVPWLEMVSLKEDR